MSAGPWIENAVREIIRLADLAGTTVMGTLTMAGNIILGAFSITTTSYNVNETATDWNGVSILVQRSSGDNGSHIAIAPSGTNNGAGIDVFSESAITSLNYAVATFGIGTSTAFIQVDKSGTASLKPFQIITGTGSTWDFGTTGTLTLAKGLIFGTNGQFTSTEQTSSQAVAHGLGKTPQQFWVEVTDSGVTGIYTQSSTADATNVTVTCTAGLKYKVHAF